MHEGVQGSILRAVVGDHHLVTRVSECEQRSNAFDDHRFLVEGRDEHRDAGGERRREQLVVAEIGTTPHLGIDLHPGESGQNQIRGVEDEEVHERHRGEHHEYVAQHTHNVTRSAASVR